MNRLRAGWFIALAYLFCVLAPTISFALPGQHSAAPCLTGESHMTGMVHVSSNAPMHMHGDGHAHDHSVAQSSVAHSSVAQVDGDHALTAIDDASASHKVPHSPNGPCCGLMCVSALPAAFADIVTPPMPTALRVTEGYRAVTDSAPVRLYRPPIS